MLHSYLHSVVLAAVFVQAAAANGIRAAAELFEKFILGQCAALALADNTVWQTIVGRFTHSRTIRVVHQHRLVSEKDGRDEAEAAKQFVGGGASGHAG